MNRNYASRIDALNNFVNNYDDEYTQNFAETRKAQYQKKLSELARENMSDLINKQITEEQRLAVENLPVFYNESKKAITTFKKRFDKGKDTKGGEIEKSATTDGVEMKDMTKTSTEPVATTEAKNITPVVDDEIETIAIRRGGAIMRKPQRVPVPDEFNPMDILGGKRVLSKNRATANLEDAGLGGTQNLYIENTESQLQRSGMSLSETAQGLKTSISKGIGKVSKVLDEGATAVTKSAGEIASAGGVALGGGLTGLAGYETGKELGASTGASVGIGVAEGVASLVAPEVAVPLAVADVVVSGLESLFHPHHHHHQESPPPPVLTPAKIPQPQTAITKGLVATPVMNV